MPSSVFNPPPEILARKEKWEAALNAEVRKIVESNGTYPQYRLPPGIDPAHVAAARQALAKIFKPDKIPAE